MVNRQSLGLVAGFKASEKYENQLGLLRPNLRREKRKPRVQERRGEKRKGKGRGGQEEGGWHGGVEVGGMEWRRRARKKDKREAQVERQGRAPFQGKWVKKGAQEGQPK